MTPSLRLMTLIAAIVQMTPALRMFTLVGVTFLLAKLTVLLATPGRLPLGRTLSFIAWPGMRPSTFAAPRCEGLEFALPAIQGTCSLAAGAALFVLARSLVTRSPAIAIMLVMLALSLMLHFGVFALSTAFWRALGFPAEDLFRKPWQARSLSEFWSRRWNVGFSDMMNVAVHRPVTHRFGRAAGVTAAFLASGILHELAISVPAGGGYGLPTIYFAVHGALVAADVRGRVVTLAALFAPLPLLFHPPFLQEIVIPLLFR